VKKSECESDIEEFVCAHRTMAESSYVFYLTSLDIVHFCHLLVSCYWVCRIDLRNLLPNLLTASFVLETRGLQKRSLKAHLTKCLCFSDSSRWGIIFFHYSSVRFPSSPVVTLFNSCVDLLTTMSGDGQPSLLWVLFHNSFCLRSTY
jgi:hypothetical protein